MVKKTSIAAGIVLAMIAGSHAPNADAAPGWGRHQDKQEQEKAAEAAAPGATRTVKGKNDIEGEIIGEAAADSPFTKLGIGMSQNQVHDLIGPGKECGAYATGKAWIPFRFTSADTVRTECAYKGSGRLIFTTQANGGIYLLKIVNDASEDGYR